MKHWLETQGYTMVYRLAGADWPGARWLHDTWAAIWYRYYCPRPVVDDRTARACVMSCNCGCSNLDHYATIPSTDRGAPDGKA